jgi:hypothetical protein
MLNVSASSAWLLQLILTPFFLGYPLVYAHLYSGIQPETNKKILIILNLLLIIFFIFMIATGAFSNNYAGVILMLIGIIVLGLGVVGSLIIEPNSISLKSESIQKVVKVLRMSFFIYIGFELLSFFLITFNIFRRMMM